MGKPNRIFILGGGKSCDSLDYVEDLEDEFTLGISRWLFVKEFKCDFYFINDCWQLLKLCEENGGLSELRCFMESNDNVKWIRNRQPDIDAFEKYQIDISTAYGCHICKPQGFTPKLRAGSYTREIFKYYSTLKKKGLFKDRFNRQTYSKVELPSSDGFCGGALTHSLSLAYSLGFTECYLVGFDVMCFKNNISEGSYSKYIMNYPESAGLSAARKENPYETTLCGWKPTFLSRYNYRGMDIRRLVPNKHRKRELRMAKKDPSITEKSKLIKTISYENFMYRN